MVLLMVALLGIAACGDDDEGGALPAQKTPERPPKRAASQS